MAVMYNQWAPGVFNSGDRVRFNGVVYEATSARAATDTDNPQLDTANWKVVAVIRIQDYNSLIEAVRLELNVDDDRINSSIPFFIQMSEQSFQTRIRAPIRRARMLLTIDDQSRVDVPEDLLQVINLRINQDDTAGDSIMSRGGTEILAGNYEEYKDLQRYYQSNIGFGTGRAIPTNYEAPVYWFDDRYFYVAPNLEMGTVLELYYYATIPQLGTTVNLVNQNGDPINSTGETVTQWVNAGNSANTFVQATDMVEVNWFVTAAPQMLLYGALTNAQAYLKDDERIALWQARFDAAEAETQLLIDRFDEGRHHTQQLFNAYSV